MTDVKAVGSALSQMAQLASRAQDADDRARPAAGGASAAPDADDRVDFTSTATRLQAVHSGLGQVPVVDSQRVEAIRGTVENGTYRVDSRRVADKLMDFERQLGRAPAPGEQ